MRRMFDEKEIKELGADGAVAEIAEGEVENAKPIYWHTIRFQRGGTPEYPDIIRIAGTMIIINNNKSAVTLDEFINILSTPGFVGVVINGLYGYTGASSMAGDLSPLLRLEHTEGQYFNAIYRDINNAEQAILLDLDKSYITIFNDLGVNKLN